MLEVYAVVLVEYNIHNIKALSSSLVFLIVAVFYYLYKKMKQIVGPS
jgi:hypothetical protein